MSPSTIARLLTAPFRGRKTRPIQTRTRPRPHSLGRTLEQLEDRSVPATAAFGGGILTITFDTANESVTVTEIGGSIQVSGTNITTATFSGVDRIVVTESTSFGGQSITFTGNPFTLAGLSVGGLDVTQVETVVFNTNVNAGGLNTYSISVDAPEQIQVNSGVTLTGGGGGVTLIGGSGSPSGNTVGVTIDGATITTTNNGNVSITGTGGSGGGGGNHGVQVINGGVVTSGGTGTVAVIGTGGGSTGSADFNHGVYVASGSQITSGGSGTVTVIGTGGGSSGDVNFGVAVDGTNSQITSGGGNVAVTGTGGGAISSGGEYNYGVAIQNNGLITSGGSGQVQVTGIGGVSDGEGNAGVIVQSGGVITSGGLGQVQVQGTGGSGLGENAIGVFLQDAGSTITSGGGNVVVIGNGGTNMANTQLGHHGVYMQTGALITSGGGSVSVQGTGGLGQGKQYSGVLLKGTTITSGGGAVSVVGSGGPNGGHGNGSRHGVFVLSGTITSGGGAVSVSGAGGAGDGNSNFGVLVISGGTITSAAGKNVTVTGMGGPGNGDQNFGVLVVGSGSAITSGAGGAVSVTGTGGSGNGNQNFGVLVNSAGLITSGGGAVQVTGTGGSGSGNNNFGVYAASGGVITAGGTGTVTVTGSGGSGAAGANHFGVFVEGLGSKITSTNANVAVTGTGGAGSGGNNFGVFVSLSGQITAGGTGTVTVIGAGGSGTNGNNKGVFVSSSGQITSGGNGTVTVTGTGGSAGDNNRGVVVASSGTITSGGNGTVTVTGTGGAGVNGFGVEVFSGGEITNGGTGAVTVTGTGGTGNGGVGVYLSNGDITSTNAPIDVTGISAAPNYAVLIYAGNIISGNNQPVTVTADSLEIDSGSTINSGTGQTWIRTRTAGTQIDLGGIDVLTGSPLTLGLTNGEIGQITAGQLVIGRDTAPASGDITVSFPITVPGTTTQFTLQTAEDVFVNAAISSSAVVTINFGSGGASTAAINAAITGTSATVTGGPFADSIIVTASGSTPLTLNGAGAGDTYAITFGSLGGTVAISDTGTSGTDAATITGTSGDDEIHVNTSVSGPNAVQLGTSVQQVTYSAANLEQLTLNGGAGDDTYHVQFANGTLPNIFQVFDVGGGTDVVRAYGTTGADSFNINPSGTKTVTLGSETIIYDTNLEELVVSGPEYPGDPTPTSPSLTDAGDTFVARPDPVTVVRIHGGNPTVAVGDTLNLSVLGVTNPVLFGTPASGGMTSASHAAMYWTSIETFPIPLGLGGQFDMQRILGTPTQPGYTPVLKTTTYTSSQGYGWTVIPAGAGYETGLPGALSGNPLAPLLHDGVNGYASTPATFRLDLVSGQAVVITAYLGAITVSRDDQYVEYSVDGGTTWLPIVTGFDLANSNITSVAAKVPAQSGPYSLLVRVGTTSTSQPWWSLAGLEVRPLSLVEDLSPNITRVTPPGSGSLPGDGLSVDTYQVTGAAPNAVLTVNANFATVLGDAFPLLPGVQVVANGSGTATFQVQRPTAGTSLTDVFSVTDFTNASNGAYTQQYSATAPTQPQVRRIDFGTATSPVGADENGQYVGWSSQLYSSSSGLGWVGVAPNATFDRGVVTQLTSLTPPATGLSHTIRDGVANSTGARTFRIDLPAGNYAVTVVMGDLWYGRDQMRVEYSVDGTNFIPQVASLTTATGEVASRTFEVSGVTTAVWLRFSDLGGSDPSWALNQIEVRPLPPTSSPAPLPGPTNPPLLSEPQHVLTVTQTSGTAVANGTNVLTYQVSGVTPNGFVTVTTPWGQLVGSDATNRVAGFQVRANGSGVATFQVQVPRSVGNLSVTLTATEVTGQGAGSLTQTWTGGGALDVDLNANSNPGATASGFVGMLPGQLASTANGFGWTGTVSNFDRGIVTTTPTPVNLYRDFHFGSAGVSGQRTFRVAVGSATSLTITLYSFDTGGTNLTNQYFIVEGAGTVARAGNVTTVTLSSWTDPNADGFIDITVGNVGANWVLNGLTVV